MSADNAAVTLLSEDECWSLLSSLSLGRLVTILGGKPEIFPVNFATRHRTVLFRTAQGTKLYSAVMGDSVAFEADYHDPALDRKSTRLNSSHVRISYAVFCFNKNRSRLVSPLLGISYAVVCLANTSSSRATH